MIKEPYKVVQSRHGLIIANPMDTYIGAALIKYGEYSELEWQLIYKLAGVKSGSIIEVGANCGALTLPLAKFAEANKKSMYAYEPQPQVFNMLAATMALNEVDKVDCTVIHAAMGSGVGKVFIPPVDYSKPGNFGAVPVSTAPTAIQVECYTLDSSFGGAQVGFLKIDVEGWELNVLQGAAKMLEHTRPVMLVENDRVDKSEALIKYLHDADYRLWWSLIDLYNADNFFEVEDNIYPNIVSCNMVCVPRELGVSIKGVEILDATKHPFKPME